MIVAGRILTGSETVLDGRAGSSAGSATGVTRGSGVSLGLPLRQFFATDLR